MLGAGPGSVSDDGAVPPPTLPPPPLITGALTGALTTGVVTVPDVWLMPAPPEGGAVEPSTGGGMFRGEGAWAMAQPAPTTMAAKVPRKPNFM
jgi:hypothetical protein